MNVHVVFEGAEQAVRDGLHFRHDTLRALAQTLAAHSFAFQRRG